MLDPEWRATRLGTARKMATRIVVGLGNPGAAYEDTRHNLGFEVVDRLAARLDIGLVIDGPMWVGATPYADSLTSGDEAGASAPAANDLIKSVPNGEDAAGGERVVLVKPATYMNLSGNAVVSALTRYPATPAEILVVVDDMSLETGAIRVRRRGSDGGHNGLRSIIAALGTREFPRLRIGIGLPAASELVDPGLTGAGRVIGEATVGARDHVLGRFTPDERTRVDGALARAERAAVAWIRKTDMQEIMNTFNRKPTRAPDTDASGGDVRPEGCSDGES